MLFGMQRPQLDPGQILAAKGRLQSRMEQDPSLPSMQPGGLIPLDITGGSSLAQPLPQAQPDTAFNWGAGGTRISPDDIAARRRTAQQQMAAGMDTTPVGHWTQGLARVAQALVGGMEQRKLNKAEQANAAESQSVVQALLNPPGAGADGAAYDAGLLSASANPYVDPIIRNLVSNERERRIKANAPEYFMSGQDRVKFDPTSGQSQVVYDAPEEFQTYANTMGYQPGTPEYNKAAQDYVLRGNGPTAYGYDVDLENTRQTNREGLEDKRQAHRVGLRSTPTYSDLHPKPRSSDGGGGGGGGGTSRPLTMAGTMAPVLAKAARGEALTPAEQNAWNMYRPLNRGRKGGGVAAALVNGGASAPSGGAVRIKSKEEYSRLPAGASFIDPNGVQRVKGR